VFFIGFQLEKLFIGYNYCRNNGSPVRINPFVVTSLELKQALKAKTVEFEAAMEAGKPHSELVKIYRELKELQYKIPYAEVSEISERIEQ